MKFLILLLTTGALAQIPLPQINLTGNIGCQGFPCLNSGTLQFTSDADRNMSTQETSATGGIKITSTVPLTATRNLVIPSGNFQFSAIENSTTGGQSVRIIGQSGTGVIISNGQTVSVWFDGTNVISVGANTVFSVFGRTGAITANTNDYSFGQIAGTLNLATQVSGTLAAGNVATLNQNTTGNAATATAFAGTPTLCSTGQAPTGILTNGNATGCTVSVNAVSIATANGVSGTSSGGSTPALTLTLGAITPSSISVTGSGIPIATESSSNTDLAGQITLVSGSGTYTLTATYATAPIVVCSDTTTAAAVKCVASTTTITFTGTGTDVINYIAIGRT